MQSLIEFIFQSFWHWLGALVLMLVPFNFIVRLIREFSNWSNTRKHGWKPMPWPKKEDIEKQTDTTK